MADEVDQEGGERDETQDHAVPEDLMQLYCELEDAGMVTPGDQRTVTEQVDEVLGK